jgi:hypothetical protein
MGRAVVCVESKDGDGGGSEGASKRCDDSRVLGGRRVAGAEGLRSRNPCPVRATIPRKDQSVPRLRICPPVPGFPLGCSPRGRADERKSPLVIAREMGYDW